MFRSEKIAILLGFQASNHDIYRIKHDVYGVKNTICMTYTGCNHDICRIKNT